MTEQATKLYSVFPTPVYIAKRDTNLSPEEEKEIRKIIKEGMHKSTHNSTSINKYIFKEKLKSLKQFCERHVNIYVNETIGPKEELDFYITQSWLNINKPGEYHHAHSHQNSLISGVFYISTEEDDKIYFHDPNVKIKDVLRIEPEEFNLFNSLTWWLPVNSNELVLFPSWLDHRVEVNEKATTDRISLSFNTFVRGTLGDEKTLTELVLK